MSPAYPDEGVEEAAAYSAVMLVRLWRLVVRATAVGACLVWLLYGLEIREFVGLTPFVAWGSVIGALYVVDLCWRANPSTPWRRFWRWLPGAVVLLTAAVQLFLPQVHYAAFLWRSERAFLSAREQGALAAGGCRAFHLGSYSCYSLGGRVVKCTFYLDVFEPLGTELRELRSRTPGTEFFRLWGPWCVVVGL